MVQFLDISYEKNATIFKNNDLFALPISKHFVCLLHKIQIIYIEVEDCENVQEVWQ